MHYLGAFEAVLCLCVGGCKRLALCDACAHTVCMYYGLVTRARVCRRRDLMELAHHVLVTLRCSFILHNGMTSTIFMQHILSLQGLAGLLTVLALNWLLHSTVQALVLVQCLLWPFGRG